MHHSKKAKLTSRSQLQNKQDQIPNQCYEEIDYEQISELNQKGYQLLCLIQVINSLSINYIYSTIMPKKQKNTGLGKALQNKIEKKRFIPTNNDRAPIFFQQTQENQAQKKKLKMKSVIQQNSLTQFLHVAQLSQQDFHANRNIKFKEIRQELTTKKIISVHHQEARFVRSKIQGNPLMGLQLPRRPQWKSTTSKQELEKLQNEAYLNWRRKLAEVEQKSQDISITPYEKNVEVWKQLWRVVQRADVLAQIVDGRNPLFFYCEDLVAYAKQLGKTRFLLIINKSDLIDTAIRLKWNEYFKSKNIDHFFFTAKQQNWVEGEQPASLNSPEVLSPHQLVQALKGLADVNGKLQIGLTGYPNVGKSSVINAVLGKKKVGVASMPGKTKHFQTLKLTDQVTLCDCPGLVFPKVSESKAEMVLNGLYPIDTIKEFEQPAQLIAFRVNKHKIEQLYSLNWKQNEPYDGESILVKYAKLKGFNTGNGLPNQAQAARYILKDYVNGVIIYNHPPPSLEKQKEPSFELYQKEVQQKKENFAKNEEKLQENLDENFFQKEQKIDANVEGIVNSLTEDDFLDLIEGKRQNGLKITKNMRKQIKFGLKRGEKAETLRKIILNEIRRDHKVLIKS